MREKSENGFSYIDVMIALVILMVGILALLSAITASVLMSKSQERQLAAKQIATSTMESIMSVKETSDASRLGWIAVGNVGTNPDADGTFRGIFMNGFQEVSADAGPDEVVGTADDSGAVIAELQREIVITDICDPQRPSYNCPIPGTLPVKFRAVQVTITYFAGPVQRQEILSTVLTDYAVAN